MALGDAPNAWDAPDETVRLDVSSPRTPEECATAVISWSVVMLIRQHLWYDGVNP